MYFIGAYRTVYATIRGVKNQMGCVSMRGVGASEEFSYTRHIHLISFLNFSALVDDAHQRGKGSGGWVGNG